MTRKFPTCRRKGGFTLLELIVVLVIISLMSALIVPRLTGPMSRMDLKTAAKKISAALRYARSQAATEKTTYVALFDFDRNRLVILNPSLTEIERAANSQERMTGLLAEQLAAAEARQDRLRSYQPPDGVILSRGVSRAGDVRTGFFPVFFYPAGSSSGGEITLADRQGRGYSLVIDFVTGMVRLEKGAAG